jgi:uncharacterized protein YjbI with pentapeptide repeats
VGAILREAKLERANLAGAHLESADLTGAVGLTQEQLDSAFGDILTVLPKGLERPAHWSAAPPDTQRAVP